MTGKKPSDPQTRAGFEVADAERPSGVSRDDIDPSAGASRAHVTLGEQLAGMGQLNEAAEVFAEAIRLDPRDAAGWHGLTDVLRLLGRLEEAEQAGRKAVTLDPGSVAAFNNLGTVLLDRGRLDQAAAFFERALEIDPSLAVAWCNLASARHGQGRRPEAAALYQRALGLDPGLMLGHRNLGWLLMNQGQWDEACPHFTAALRILADRPDLFDPAAASDSSGLGLESSSCRTALLAAKAALDCIGVVFFLTYGTLLGLIREQDFISHDSDIDIGIWPGTPGHRIVETMTGSGFSYHGQEDIGAAINYPFRHANGVSLEIYQHFEVAGSYHSGFDFGGEQFFWGFSRFELKDVAWLGSRFLIPADTERYLTEGYGDWRRPNRFFDATFWSPNIVGGYPPISRAFAHCRTTDKFIAGDFASGLKYLERILVLEPGNQTIARLHERMSLKVSSEAP